MCQPSLTEHHGLTLAEVLVFVAVVAMAVLALISAQLYAVRSITGNRERHTASTAVFSILSEIQQQQHQDFSGNCSQALTNCTYFPGYQSVVEQIYTDGTATMKRIDVSVYWDDSQGRHDFSAWTYLYKTP